MFLNYQVCVVKDRVNEDARHLPGRYVEISKLTYFYVPATKWPGHIVLPISVIPLFRNKTVVTKRY
jgi:hypothetical protein